MRILQHYRSAGSPSRSVAGLLGQRKLIHCEASGSSAGSLAAAWIAENLPDLGGVIEERSLGGSGWNSTYIVKTGSGKKLFVKTSPHSNDLMFRGEALGLRAMADTKTIRNPKVFHYGVLQGGNGGGGGQSGSFIIMEALDLSGGGRASQADLGRALAAMHLADPKDPEAAKGRFGFSVDNTIGGTSQPNGWMDSWIDFFRERRLAHQLRLTGDSSLQRYGDQLLPRLEVFFEGVGEIRPSILHGDLWSGNIASCDAQPVIFDPASYYGHHEAEWGMSWCAGFSDEFWRSYHEVIPRALGWEARHKIYTLYHVLNHLNLFGDGYYSQAESIMRSLVAKI